MAYLEEQLQDQTLPVQVVDNPPVFITEGVAACEASGKDALHSPLSQTSGFLATNLTDFGMGQKVRIHVAFFSQIQVH
jgi:hypothetical protein